MASTILIVEDEEDLLGPLVYDLSRAGFVVESAMTGAGALERLAAEPRPDLLLLDLMLPDLPGTELCKRVRADERLADLPVIMLTARGAEADRVRGFELGADDYVVKPFSTRELILRLQALLRRRPAKEEGPRRFGVLELDLAGAAVRVEGEPLSLTALELKLLSTLFERRGRVQSRGQLLTEVWDASEEMVTRTVDTHVKRLRQKLGVAGAYIETVRGLGYRFLESPPADEGAAR
ncbi:MAG: response regulator transcription factor [Deltaproteobacteria bacterium]|nr:response regulator transcription factor [Deltaproteobacteria bacterium]